MKKNNITKITRLPHNVASNLTVRNVARVVMTIMRSHIGEENALTGNELFKKVFGKKRQTMASMESLVDELRWSYLKRAMHYLRKNTKCFIIGKEDEGNWEYFVVSTQYEADYYINILQNNIKRMKYMQKKVRKAVKEKWYLKEWDEKKLLS